jgi:hypothetical protein
MQYLIGLGMRRLGQDEHQQHQHHTCNSQVARLRTTFPVWEHRELLLSVGMKNQDNSGRQLNNKLAKLSADG